MKRSKASQAASVLGKRSYRARLQRFGIERIREIARENGKLGGRPRKEEHAEETISQQDARRGRVGQ